MAMNWEGVFCALWTHTDTEGALMEREIREHVRFLRKSGIHGFLALGSTGEFLHLDIAQRKDFLEIVRSEAGDLPVIANISDIRPRAVADLARFAKQIHCAAVALLPPYFYPVAQPDLIEWFVHAGEAAQLPLFLYNFPERTGNRIALETIAAVTERINVAGVKQSGAEFAYHRPLVELGRQKNFAVFTGSDTRLPEAMAMGAIGCVSGLSNAVPELVVEIFEACRAGDANKAAVSIKRMQILGEEADKLEFPLNVAAMMEARGRATGHEKVLVCSRTRQQWKLSSETIQQLFQEWRLRK